MTLDAHVRRELVAFVAHLREAGVAVPGDGAQSAARAVAALDARDAGRVRAALRAALCTRPGDGEAFDRLFDTFWARVRGENADYPRSDGSDEDNPLVGRRGDDAAATPDEDGGGSGFGDGSGGEDAGRGGRGDAYTADAGSRPVSLDAAPPDSREAVAAFTDALAALPGRRWTTGEETPDVRRALRESVRYGGVPMERPTRSRESARVRGVALVDVSESVLDALDRDALLSVLHALRRAWNRLRVFFFDTSLREVSDAFDAQTTEDAVAALTDENAEWSGGTRLTDALRSLRTAHASAVGRDRVVVVVSDGLERGGVTGLERELAWLSRRAGLLLWLNPLAADEQWSPNAPGMRAALSFVDGVYPFVDATDLSRAAESLSRVGPTRRVR
ncbi:VWA domain-containing protein [Salarchaeum japonicum]|uniref:VWA domain-containing protein n=1 Tax=Salarchaeum japonicum TaxID=555573 RepID=A0AAV3T2Z9_9EURY|nr:VWA domain-containing protein [Salarchaeum japonicum]